jgi:ATP-dependent Lon protease
MTGEITLRGEVLPIGGLKEKLLAALRGGIDTVLIPYENKRELIEIPKNIQQHIDVRAVRWIDEVLEVALEKIPKPIVKLGSESDSVKEDKIKKHDENDLIRAH